jgi:hypothetical protein
MQWGEKCISRAQAWIIVAIVNRTMMQREIAAVMGVDIAQTTLEHAAIATKSTPLALVLIAIVMASAATKRRMRRLAAIAVVKPSEIGAMRMVAEWRNSPPTSARETSL